MSIFRGIVASAALVVVAAGVANAADSVDLININKFSTKLIASNSSSLTWTDIGDGNYTMRCDDLVTSGDSNIAVQFGYGGTSPSWWTSSYSNNGNSTAHGVLLTSGVSGINWVSSVVSISGVGPDNYYLRKLAAFVSGFSVSGATGPSSLASSGNFGDTSDPANAIRVIDTNSHTINSGECTLSSVEE